jgi:hypothetical protein
MCKTVTHQQTILGARVKEMNGRQAPRGMHEKAIEMRIGIDGKA